MRVAVIIFPGINRDKDMVEALRSYVGASSIDVVFHKDSDLPQGVDLIVLSGGFSYGDYLRAGAIAASSPIMRSVIERANSGVCVLGVCNGFQILCESGLLEGCLMRNRDLSFICDYVHLRVESSASIFTRNYVEGSVIRIPIAHQDGNYYASDDVYRELEGEGRILFRYCSESGETGDDYNPNGSLGNVAGIVNSGGNVFGFMPHFENACFSHHGSVDGGVILESLRASL